MLPALCLFLALQAPPQADPAQAKARAQVLLKEGSALYQNGDYAGALEKFEAAFGQYPSAKLYYNIATASRDLGRPVEALDAFEKFIAQAQGAPPEAMADARKSVVELRKKLGQIAVDCAVTGTEVSVDGRRVGLTPLPGPVWATPGRHQIAGRHPSYPPALEDAEVAAGRTTAVALRLQPTATASGAAAPLPIAGQTATPPMATSPGGPAGPAEQTVATPAPPTGPPAEGWWLGRRWTWVAAGGAAVFAAGATIAGISMQSRFDALNSQCGSKSATRPGCTDDQIASVQGRQTIANVMWGGAALAAIGAGVLFYAESKASVVVAPMASDGSVGLAAAGRF